MTTSHQLTTPHSRVASTGGRTIVLALCVLGAGLMVVSGAIHLHLWNEYYRHIKTGHMNVLFMVQLVLAFLGAAAVLALRNRLAVAAGGLLMAGTAVGYLIARYHHGGLFGFYLGPTFSSSDATWSLIVEIGATVVFAISAVVMAREKSGPT
jgi:hypothetical protein